MNCLTPIYPKATVFAVGAQHTAQYIRKTDGAAFAAYRRELEAQGFRLCFEKQSAGNTFLTYASGTAYAHLYYVVDTRTVRVISGPTDVFSLPDLTPPTDADLSFPSTVTQMVLDYYYYDEQDPASRKDGNYGACYIVTLDDGSLLLYDGGGRYGKNDVERLWALLNHLGRRDRDGKIVIAAWVITHEHQDHFWCAHHVMLQHGSEIKLGGIYCTPIARELLLGRSDLGNLYIESPDALQKIRGAVGDFKLIRMHTGQEFFIRNVKVEVLSTPEDIFPEHADRYYDFNDTTAVMRLTVNGKTLLNLGDAYHVSSRVLVGLWGNALKSDYCTLAHHGWGGGTRSLYDHIAPNAVLVPFSRRWITRILTEETYHSKSQNKDVLRIQWAIDRYGDFHKITQHVFHELLQGEAERFLLADGCNKTLDLTSGTVKNETVANEQIGYPY